MHSCIEALRRKEVCVRRSCGMFYFDSDGDVNDIEYFWVIKGRQLRHPVLVAVVLPQHQHQPHHIEPFENLVRSIQSLQSEF